MNIPENPYRKAMANLYMERYMGKPMEKIIKEFVNGEDEDFGEKSLDYYIAAERFLSRAFNLLGKFNTKESEEDRAMITMMITYASYEIERLSAMKNKD